MKPIAIDVSKVSKSFAALNPGLFAMHQSPVQAVSAQKPLPVAKKCSYAENVMEMYLSDRVRDGEIKSFAFEAVTLKVGEPCCRYTSDFACWLPDGRLRLIECKGRKMIWEDGFIKLKAAIRQYPDIEFQLYHIAKGLFERKF